MNSIIWLGIGYGIIWFIIGIYLAFLGNTQKNIIATLAEIEGKHHD